MHVFDFCHHKKANARELIESVHFNSCKSISFRTYITFTSPSTNVFDASLWTYCDLPSIKLWLFEMSFSNDRLIFRSILEWDKVLRSRFAWFLINEQFLMTIFCFFEILRLNIFKRKKNGWRFARKKSKVRS